eukprot:15361180-Ditylum_brightwellii.AAC.1
MCSSNIEDGEGYADCSGDDSSAEDRKCPPPLSIAGGVDYGSSNHLKNLALLNVMERAILSVVCQYKTVIKINFSSRGSRNLIKGHVISFDHNAPHVLSKLLHKTNICKSIKIIFVGPKEQMNMLTKHTLGSSHIT